MSEIAKRPLPLSPLYKEFNLSRPGDQHNDFVGELFVKLHRLLEKTNLVVKLNTFRYLDDWQINVFGDFKNVMNLENFVAGLIRFDASKEFIQNKLDEYTGVGAAPMGYAPDVFIVEKSKQNNEFAVPLVVFEVISAQSRQHDLFYKPFFYETIGVKECFICEALLEAGTIVRAYRLENQQYQPIAKQDDRYFSEVIRQSLPRVWELQ